MSGRIAKAAIGSAHLTRQMALIASPAKAMNDRYAHSADCAASALKLRCLSLLTAKRWTRENPIRNVSIPSDEDATRIYVISPKEEKHYFKLAAKNQDLWDLGRLMLNQESRPEELYIRA